MARTYDLLVIGELNVDIILSGIESLPAFGQVEQPAENALFTLGSSSAILACGAARLGMQVGFVGKLGNDPLGHFILNTLRTRGVRTEHIVVDDSLKTGVTVHLTRGTDRVMFTFAGAIAALQAKDIPQGLVHQARHVQVSSYFLQTGLQPGLGEILRQARKGGAVTLLDPGYDPSETWNHGLSEVLRQVDIFMPNAQEALAITGARCIDEAMHTLAGRIPTVVIKEGAAGAQAQAGTRRERHRGFKVNAVDSVGAGDSFDAGFLYAQSHGMDLATSLTWGCACGALATTRVGGIDGQPDVSQVEGFLTIHHLSESL